MSSVLPGLCSVTFRALEPEDIVELAAESGVSGIEWGADVHVPLGDRDAAARVAELCAEAGLACPSYGTYVGIDPRSRAVDACATAVALGADNLRVWTPFGGDEFTDADARAPVVADLRDVASTAADHGLTVGVEFHADTITHTAESTVRLIEDVDAPNLFSYWQPVYWDPAVNLDPARQLAELDTIGEYLSHIHTYWWEGRERHPLAAGAATWRSALERARQQGRWTKPRYAFLEFVPGDDPDLLRREAGTLIGWLTASETPSTPPSTRR